jgi:energy-coupling factor transport system ATP-binding protein
MIEFRDVTFVHPTGVTALNHVSLQIEDGETVAIIGENGAGKTTLVKHITGLLKPSSGSVLVDGENTKQKSTAELSRKVGVAFQNPDHQLFSESVEAEVAFALRNFGFAEDLVKQRVERSLHFFGLEEYRNSSPLVLSGGEKKRLTLACILSWDPQVVVLDEPTVGQDSIQKEKLSQIVMMLRSEAKTVVLVSHDIEFLWPMQPRVVVMSKGRVLADGPADKVMSDGDMLAAARVTQPRLISLCQHLKKKPSSPYVDFLDARRSLREMLK